MIMAQKLKATWPLLLGMFIIMVGNGLLGTVLSLRASQIGMPNAVIGIVQSFNSVGCILGCLMAARLIRALGHGRTMPLVAVSASLAAVLPALSDTVAVWMVSRVATGFCLACLYVAAESWIASDADAGTRSTTLSIYFAIQTGGMSLGQFFLTIGDVNGLICLLVVSILFALAFAPLVVTSHNPGFVDVGKSMSARNLMRMAPVAVVGAFVGGTMMGALFVTLPLLGISLGLDAPVAAKLVFAFSIGAAIAQGLAAALSGRIGPRGALGVFALIGLPLCLTCVGFDGTQSTLRLMVVFSFLGLSTGPIYGLCLCHLTNHCAASDVVNAAGTLTFFQASGWVVGPALGPLIAQHFGSGGFFGFVFAVDALWILIIAASFLRQRVRATKARPAAS